MANNSAGKTHSESQIYLSTRDGDYGLSFETVVLKGLAADGGLFLPHQIPLASDWRSWKDLSYEELALRIFSLYVSSSEIPADDLKAIIDRSYSTFRAKEVTPLVHLQDNNLYLLELFHGPSYSFKDCALQFLGNLFEYFLARKNQGKEGKDRHHLTVVGATSGDTGSAAIYGLRGKKDVSVVILHPQGRVSPIQEAQMTTCLDANVHNVAVTGTFDDCQDIVKALFSDPDTNETLKLGAVNSINFSRILAQIVYYFYSYFSLVRKSTTFNLGDQVRFVVPTGNFGDILAGYFACRMGLPVDKLRHCNKRERHPRSLPEDRSIRRRSRRKVMRRKGWPGSRWSESSRGWCTGNTQSGDGHPGQEVSAWLKALKVKGGFGPVSKDVLDSARRSFESERVSDPQTLDTIKTFYNKVGYILDPHSAVGVTAALRSLERADPNVPHISLSTAHPAKFAGAVELALKDKEGFNFEAEVLPQEFVGLDKKAKRVITVENDWKVVRELVKKQVKTESQAQST
ncbi:threonine synthase [Coccidioides immitis H538.4]|uniref:Threonine synthase n=1 Tax=Coccidioides immitis H538.4 TaxID=396776 RepID=A0A0J8RR44_COCIT|nr:threonine synthase [Coccidioides immitis H538.4]